MRTLVQTAAIAFTAGIMALVRLASVPGATGAANGAKPAGSSLTLWYRRPAREWVEALPIGNGRLGAMVFGGVPIERLQLNEDTLYAGGPYDPANPEALGALPAARRLVFEGRYADAEALIGEKMLATPARQMPYELVGNLLLTFAGLENGPSVADYRRDLDLDTAIAGVSYSLDGTRFRREVFSSPVDQVIALRLTANRPGRLTFRVSMDTPQNASIYAESTDTLVMRGVNGEARGIRGALTFQARVAAIAEGGETTAEGDALSIRAADTVTVLVAAATSYRTYKDVSGDPEALTRTVIAAARAKGFDRLERDHVAEHQRLFRRVALDLPAGPGTDLPTDERIAGFASGGDPQLAALYFQFGRYLLLSSSRPGGQPANLQGLWNDSMTPPWESKYTININTEMNYWPAEPTNLSETVEPLVAMIQDISETGGRTARVQWGARGWVAHHNTDLWRATAPVDGPRSGMWPTGGAWLCLHLWEHYQFGGDREFLARVYPILKGAAQFFLDTLVEEPPHHWLVTVPSLSPENRHPFGTSICAGPTLDMEILRDLFTNTIRAAEILGIDAGFRTEVAAARARLAPFQIGKGGQLQEWLEDWDLEAPDIHHRHVSHLYALFPGAQITLRGTPDLAAAARKSLEIRGDNATGWGLGWRLNLWARLQDAEHAYRILTLLLAPARTYPDMFDAHPPFQIDGNFGGSAGIAEMLLQSHADAIELLPALPHEWPSGRVIGLRARGGFDVDIEWMRGQLVAATIHSRLGKAARLRYGASERAVTIPAGQTFRWDGH